jgi:hypothetical protein
MIDIVKQNLPCSIQKLLISVTYHTKQDFIIFAPNLAVAIIMTKCLTTPGGHPWWICNLLNSSALHIIEIVVYVLMVMELYFVHKLHNNLMHYQMCCTQRKVYCSPHQAHINSLWNIDFESPLRYSTIWQKGPRSAYVTISYPVFLDDKLVTNASCWRFRQHFLPKDSM